MLSSERITAVVILGCLCQVVFDAWPVKSSNLPDAITVHRYAINVQGLKNFKNCQSRTISITFTKQKYKKLSRIH